MQGDNQVSGYFDIEKPRFTLEHGPTWLNLNPDTGLLTGVPDHVGSADVAITTTLEREIRKLDEKVLAWGNEKVLSKAVEPVGKATQTFVIETR
jgi:hypothetical protein